MGLKTGRAEDEAASSANRGATEIYEEELGRFLSKGVTEGTRSGYAASWRAWGVFLGKESSDAGRRDVFLERMRSDTERAVKLALFFKEGYENGRQATAVSAGIRHYFAAALKSVDWFESQIVASARAACRLSCDELREQKKEAKSKATLPVSEDMLSAARVRLWASKG